MGWWVVALILKTVGIWAVAAGFIAQFNAALPASMVTAQAVLPWYFGGLLLIGLGKMAKWKCFGACMMHSK